jgi:hypothetical protein
MTENDKSLLQQMIAAGKFNYGIYELLVEYNKQQAKEMIAQMGPKWCLHPDNATKKLDMPLQILDSHRISGSRVLDNFSKGRKK